ncbi:MAG: SPOR domain-containing protein [Nitrosomonadales bacterium]|nr:SPOR domain-containing protein [Nitrosomonadales bacterium]
MAKQQTDDELNLRRKARRRLIGAIAFTLAVVVILPMVLDSEPKPTGKDIDLRIPAPDKVGEFVPGVAASEVAETLPLAASAVAAASAIPPVIQADSEKPVAVPTVATSDSKTEVQGKIQPAPDKKPEPKKPEPKNPESKKTESKNPDKPTSVESYVAQVGAYSNAATAKQELDKLKKWGFKAYTEKVGDKIRVRVGPYTEREKAEKARQLLEKRGLHPVVTNEK